MTENLTANQAILRSIWRDRIHTQHDALENSPSETQAAFAHIWAPAESLLDALEQFPTQWLDLWLTSGQGHIVLTHTRSVYQGEWINWRATWLASVCYICISDIHQRREPAFHALLHLFDHLLGSGAQPDQEWFSSGGGITQEIAQVSARFLRIHELGYGHKELDVIQAADYFSHTFWLYLNDPRRLNRLDPLVYRLYHAELIRLPL